MTENQLTDSRFGVYKGIIALAWADHELEDEEKAELSRLISGNLFMSEEQRNALLEMIAVKRSLDQIWHEISEARDRAFLINLADVIFHADGDYCKDERELHDRFMQKHMATLDTEQLRRDLALMAIQQAEERQRLQEKMNAYSDEYSMIRRIGRMLDEIF